MTIGNNPIYTPTPPTIAPQTDDARNLADWLQRELRNISNALTNITRLQLVPLSAPPATPREGLVEFADGTNWNPLGLFEGSKKALVVYMNGGWVQSSFGPSLTITDPGGFTMSSVSSQRPFFFIHNDTNDFFAPVFEFAKSRVGGATQAGDQIGDFEFAGFAAGAFQQAAAIQVQQTTAPVGSFFGTRFVFFTSDTLGQTNHNLTIDNKGIIIPDLIAVAAPSNANAATAGVALNQLYRDTADPSKVYVRTV